MKKMRNVLPFLLIAGSLATLTSCGNKEECSSCPSCDDGSSTPAHTHTKATDYSYDENGHYHACEGCTENVRFDYEGHDYHEVDGIKSCSVCGYIPNKDLQTVYQSLKKALEAYSTDKTLTMTISSSQTSIKGGSITYVSNSNIKSTIDAERNLYYSYDDEMKLDKSSSTSVQTNTTYEYAYVKDDDENITYYSRNGDEKKTYKSDKYMVQNLYESNLFINYYAPTYYANLDNFEEYKKALDHTYNGGDSYDSVKAEYSAEAIEGGYRFDIDVEQIKAYTYSLTKYTQTYVFFLKNDVLTELEMDDSYSQTYADGYETRTVYNNSVEFSYDFNQNFYDSFDKSGYTDSGEGESFYCQYYYKDYKIGSNYNNKYQVGQVLSKNTYVSGAVTYGDIYLDKEMTQKYDGQALTGANYKLYVKPTVKDGDYAKVVLLSEKTYVDASGFGGDYKSCTWSSGQDVAVDAENGGTYTVTYTELDGHKVGQYYVNGAAIEGNTFQIEKGQVYIVEYKMICYA